MAKTNHHQRHVAAIAFPFGSHADQMLNITRKFAVASPDVTFSFFSTAKSNQFLFGSTCSVCPEFHNIKVFDVDDGVPKNHVFSGHPIEEIELFIKAAPDNIKKAIEKAVSDTNKKISCVTNDAFLWMVGNIAEELGVPWIPVWAPGASSLSSHFYTNLIRESTTGGDEPVSFIPGMDNVRYCDLPDEIRIYSSQSLFCHMLDMAGEMMPRATAIAINSFEELECPIIEDLKSKTTKMCLAVGPLTLVSPSPSDPDDPHCCLSWLDDKKPTSVAYVSFGTKATPPPQELAALADGLEASGVPFLWSLKDYAKKNLPDGFLKRTSERGKVVPWTPQVKVLCHSAIGVIVTHCGWNSVLESIMDGVPIIYRPFFGDHTLIGRFVSTVWEIGVKAGDEGVFTKDGTVKALDLILRKEEGKKIRQKVEKLRELGKQALGPTGSTTKNFNTLLEIVTRS
ncbi:Udp-glycosyltransferase 78d2 [Thalictrum thalictroides]|uniref:Udp-glycosyltransferase 78d2 n=1 Tax=Thalictrum thalictroides TaxID=46969 RepID=A0A7J6WU37_THATH|nr:Udp-glycosyltransferase 78d2 [Thalictrum thalictroides]